MTFDNGKGALGYGPRQAASQAHRNSAQGAGQGIPPGTVFAFTGTSQSVQTGSGNGPGAYDYAWPVESPPEDAGIRVGEIEAWRAWIRTTNDGLLHSVTMGDVWLPNEPFEASGVDRMLGVYAFKTMTQARAVFGPSYNETIYAIGRVALWGEVWEFDKGWHAEFARILSLDWPMPRKSRWRKRWLSDPLADIRATYNLPLPPA
jgi:hypothetical protein